MTRIWQRFCLWIYALSGWTVEGQVPNERKFVIIAAPHTSNWDFPLMLCVAFKLRLRIHWIGKASLFRPPFGPLMRALGGIAVDRTKSQNVVAQMVERFACDGAFALAIPPEGTRAKVTTWKTGFYNIAHGANVPILLGFLDYRRKVGGVGGIFRPTGDIEADMSEIRAFYHRIPSHRDVRESAGA